MSAPDVLAVLEAAIDEADGLLNEHGAALYGDHCRKLREARAAVAELIETKRALASALRYVMACVGDSGSIEHAAREAAVAALVGVKWREE